MELNIYIGGDNTTSMQRLVSTPWAILAITISHSGSWRH